MRLATIGVVGGTRAVRIDGGQAVETGHSDVGALLAEARMTLTTEIGGIGRLENAVGEQ